MCIRDSSSATEGGSTETGALFAGTGSEILPPTSSRRAKKRKRSETSGKMKELQLTEVKRKRKTKGKSCDHAAGSSLDGRASSSSYVNDQVMPSTSSSRAQKKEQKKRKKRRRKDAAAPAVDGVKIEGLERTGVFEPGGDDEEGTSNQEQDDYILKRLFKKSGEIQTNIPFQLG